MVSASEQILYLRGKKNRIVSVFMPINHFHILRDKTGTSRQVNISRDVMYVDVTQINSDWPAVA